MLLTPGEELHIFFYSVLGGALIMLLYDIFSVTFKKGNLPFLVITVCDGIFVFSACAITIFITLSVPEYAPADTVVLDFYISHRYNIDKR